MLLLAICALQPVHAAPIIDEAETAAGGELHASAALFAGPTYNQAGMASPDPGAARAASPTSLTADIVADNPDVARELRQQSRELFATLTLLTTEEGSEPEELEPVEEDIARTSPKVLLERFIGGEDSRATIDLASDYQRGSVTAQQADLPEQFEYWSEDIARDSSIEIPLQAGGDGGRQSFLHRFFCLVGLVSPQAAGLDENCDYLLH